MISNGALNGSPIGKYPQNGGGIVTEATGRSTSAIGFAARFTVRRLAAASAAILLKGEWLSVTGLSRAAVRVRGVLKVRKINKGATVISVEGEGVALRRPVVSASASAAIPARGRALRRPLAIGKSRVAVAPAGKMLRRPIATASAFVAANAVGKVLRRPIATAAIAVVFGHLAQAGYLYFRPTDRRRIVTVFERRQTQIAAEYRAVPIHRENREFIIPREAGI